MDGEVRIGLLGTELLLRPVRAAGLLTARREARGLTAELGGDAAAGRILLGASLLARGAYADGEPAFADARQVLELLTAEEILSASAEYGGEAEPDWLAEARGESAAAEETQRSGAAAPEVLPAAENAGKGAPPSPPETQAGPGNAAAPGAAVSIPARRADSAPEAVSGPSPVFPTEAAAADAPQKSASLPAPNARRAGETEAAAGAEPAAPAVRTPPAQTDPAAPPGRRAAREPAAAPEEPDGFAERVLPAFTGGHGDMQAISDYFERDSRRYDGAFVRY